MVASAYEVGMEYKEVAGGGGPMSCANKPKPKPKIPPQSKAAM